MKYGLILVLLSLALTGSYVTGFQQHTLLNRLIRAANANKKQACRYEKEAWEECDPTTGQQRRVLKLKSSRSTPTDCEPEKFIQRPCKKNCRYSKGVWSDCANGVKHRIDTIKAPSLGCEASRNITKTCKEPCHYVKSDWSPCENGVKAKTLTLENEGAGLGSGCEPTKVIRKQCRSAKQGRRERPRGRKNNVPSTDS